MGAAASLSPEQKALISKDIQAKIKEIDASSEKLTPNEILRELALIYEADLLAAKSESFQEQLPLKKSLRMSVDDDHQLVDLDRVEAETTKLLPNEITEPGSPAPPVGIGRSTSSADLLNKTNNLLESQAKISSFINQLKEGDITTRRSSGFRIRRLTYAQKTAEEPEKPLPLTSKRTTIYASREIGVTQEKAPPFPPDILGTYSCHGIEPAEDCMEGIKELDPDDPNADDIYTGIHQKTNQDRGCVVHPYNNSDSEAFFLVLDGHGEQGDRVSEFAMRSIVQNVEKYLKESPDDIEEALTSGFVNTNTALMTTPIKYMTSGSTCVSLYIRGTSYYVANCGDSRAVLARLQQSSTSPLTAIDLSRDHKPDDPIEMARITSWGGFVSPVPEPGLSARVWLDPEYTMIGLAMARSIGDYAVKNVGVIPIPEIIRYEFHPSDKFIIMASDGVWEFISSQEAVDIVQSYIHLGSTFACQQLIQTAASRWQEEEGDYRDDITAIIFTLPLPLKEHNSLYNN
mmetsp:Transcript_2522/g.2484  ORF Transcript_2522/g.2484 Transcript_2522/m.2484 type:complete len:516 (-) Transcript_2522:142-1689(-)